MWGLRSMWWPGSVLDCYLAGRNCGAAAVCRAQLACQHRAREVAVYLLVRKGRGGGSIVTVCPQAGSGMPSLPGGTHVLNIGSSERVLSHVRIDRWRHSYP